MAAATSIARTNTVFEHSVWDAQATAYLAKYGMNKLLKEAYADWWNDERYTIFATLAFHPNLAPDRDAAIGKARNVLNRLDVAVLGKQTVQRNGIRIPRVVVYQEGAGSLYPHLHVLLSDAGSDEALTQLATIWDELNFGPKSTDLNKGCRFEPIEDNKAVANYLAGEFYQLGTDTYVPDLSVGFPDKDTRPDQISDDK